MSLETALSENTAALKALHAMLAQLPGITLNAPVVAEAQAEKQAKPDAKKSTKVEQIHSSEKEKARSSAQTQTVADSSTGSSSESQPADEAEAKTYSYEDVKAAVLEVSKVKGRETVVGLLQRFGVSKAPDLLPASYADVITVANEVLAGAEV